MKIAFTFSRVVRKRLTDTGSQQALVPFDKRDPSHRAALVAVTSDGSNALGSPQQLLEKLSEDFGLVGDEATVSLGLALAEEAESRTTMEVPIVNVTDAAQEDTVVDLRQADGVDPEVLGQHDSVMAALAAHYEELGHKAQQLWVSDLDDGTTGMFDIWIPDLKRIIDVETTDTIITIDPHRYDAWKTAGYEVWVVAPIEKLPNVERRLTKYVDRIQPWSLNGPKVVFEELAPTD